MIYVVLAFMLTQDNGLGQPPPNPPFNYDKALIEMMSPDRKWSRAYYHKDGTMLGIVQEERRLGLGLMIQDRYPFSLPSTDKYNEPKHPYRMIAGVSSLHNK